MSLLDVDEKYINDEYFRSKGWMKSDENPGCIERQVYIMNGADSPIIYIRFLLGLPMSIERETFKESVCLEKERFKLLCSIESHLGGDSYMTIPIDVLYIDLDCT